MAARYYPQFFDAAEMEAAKGIILTAEGPGADTETRWAIETPHVVGLIREAFDLRADTVVLDYGCGIGRIAKALIEASGCFVIGLDISPNMRALAPAYVQSDRFAALSPDQFDTLVAAGLRVNFAISIWVLQHCLAPAEDIERIRRSLAADGTAFILNMPKRAIPAVLDVSDDKKKFAWASDSIDVADLLRGAFRVEAEGSPQTPDVPNMADAGAFWMKLRPRDPDAA